MYRFLSVCGVEIELMIVRKDDLRIASESRYLLSNLEDSMLCADNGAALSNELVQHVIEIKTAPPLSRPLQALKGFKEVHTGLREALELHPRRLALLGSGMHPWLRPMEADSPVRLWEWEDADIYNWYDRVFDCRRHGFSNLQSIHLNIPFKTDAEFVLLHSAIRVLLPLIPALCASSPFMEGALSGLLDTRLDVYARNQARYPQISAEVIPEAYDSETAYAREVFEPLERLLRTLPDSGIIDSQWLNSRGAIARFDRGSIEIRLMDTQECLAADLCCAELVFWTVCHLCALWRDRVDVLRAWSQKALVDLLAAAVRDGEGCELCDPEYVGLFGVDRTTVHSAKDLWQALAGKCSAALQGFGNKTEADVFGRFTDVYRRRGTLASAIRKAAATDSLEGVYRHLLVCEREGRFFEHGL